jgi:hypothetical protein
MRNGRLTEALDALANVYDEQNWLDRILMAGVSRNVKGPSHAERVLKRAIDEKDMPSNLRAMAHGSLGTAVWSIVTASETPQSRSSAPSITRKRRTTPIKYPRRN